MFEAFACRHAMMLAAIALGAVVLAAPASAQSDQEKLVAAAEKTFDNFVRDPDMTWFQQNIGRARAVLIAPSIVKAGFIFGGSGGRAALLAPDPKTGRWSGPAFYTLATGSIGFQAGIEVSEVVMLVMTDKGLNSLLGGSFKIGGDASIAAGPVGAGAQSSIQADLVSYSRSKGLYGGLNLDGSSVSPNDDWNQAYYRQAASATDILIRHDVKKTGAARLQNAVAAAARKK